MRIVLFDDNSSALLPFTYLYPSWDVNVGGVTLEQWIRSAFPHNEVTTHPGAYQSAGLPVPHLALNGRLLPSPALAAEIIRLQEKKHPVTCYAGNELAYALHSGGAAEKQVLPEVITLMRAPWEIVQHLEETLALATGVRKKGMEEVRQGVFAQEGFVLPDTVVTRAERGSIVIGAGTTFGSFIVLEGPLLLGTKCVVRDQTVLARASIGNVCKIGGEIEDSVMGEFSNKQHYGYFGHSVAGSWVNMGAGTTASDLKHTYGTIRVDRGLGEEETGMQFCGSFLGDGAKTAIHTSLMGGSVIGLNAFVFGTVKGFIPSFSSSTSQGFIEMPYEVALKMRERMMARRGMAFSPQDRNAFFALYERTAAERALHKVKQGILT